MRNFTFLLLVCLLYAYFVNAQAPVDRFTISGYVREADSQEALPGVNVYVSRPTASAQIGTTTNTFGFFSLTLPANDSLSLTFSLVGYDATTRTVSLRNNTTLNVLLAPGRTLAEVEVRGNRPDEKLSERAQMSAIELPVAQIKKIPAFLGEKDVLKVLQLMPGVQKGSEGQTGIYVRGGGPDQNLIILDDAVVYNASHLFGFFSVFNGDALKSVELIKGGFPARYGGRLSSVIELNLKEGNKEKLHGEGGIGLIASRLTLEGPLTKNKKASFLISARRTYLDILAAPLIKAQSNGMTSAGYYFYDLNAKINYELDPKNRIYLSSYLGRDKFYSDDRSLSYSYQNGLQWGNATGTFRWNHLFSEKVFANTSLIFSNYRFGISSDTSPLDYNPTNPPISLRYSSGVRDYTLKYDVDIYPTPEHSLRVGLQTTFHRFTPSAVVFKQNQTDLVNSGIDPIDVLESGLYAEDTWRPANRWRVNGGVRISQYAHKNATYVRPEPRLSAAYVLRPGLSIKGSYALMNQYVHLLSNTGIGLPTDLWVPTTDRIKPQQSQQVALGIAKDFTGSSSFANGLTLTVEGYYKKLSNIISYREGASFLLIDDPTSARRISWEDNVTSGRGWSYGAEFFLQKKVGRFTGWTGYTFSWTQWQFAELNNGQPFFPRYDRRHDVSVVGIYELSKRITLSGVWVYGTGQALTVPRATYTAFPNQANPPYLLPPSSSATQQNTGWTPFFDYGRQVQDYGAKNSFRAEPYHRFDVSIQFHKQKKHHERTWEFSVYNLYNRRNPFFYQLDSQTSFRNGVYVTETKLRRYSVFPIVPSISYNFKF